MRITLYCALSLAAIAATTISMYCGCDAPLLCLATFFTFGVAALGVAVAVSAMMCLLYLGIRMKPIYTNTTLY